MSLWTNINDITCHDGTASLKRCMWAGAHPSWERSPRSSFSYDYLSMPLLGQKCWPPWCLPPNSWLNAWISTNPLRLYPSSKSSLRGKLLLVESTWFPLQHPSLIEILMLNSDPSYRHHLSQEGGSVSLHNGGGHPRAANPPISLCAVAHSLC